MTTSVQQPARTHSAVNPSPELIHGILLAGRLTEALGAATVDRLGLIMRREPMVFGIRQPFAAFGHHDGVEIAFVPRDEIGAEWAIEVEAPWLYLGVTAVGIDVLAHWFHCVVAVNIAHRPKQPDRPSIVVASYLHDALRADKGAAAGKDAVTRDEHEPAHHGATDVLTG